MTNILLVALLCLLAVGLLAIYVKLVEIGDSVAYSCHVVERLKDEIVEEDEGQLLPAKAGELAPESDATLSNPVRAGD